MIGGFAAASILAVRDGPDHSTAPGHPTPPGSLLPAPADECGGYGEILPAADVDALRMIPIDLPAGIDLSAAEATRSVTDCVDVDPALILLSEAAGATIHVEGPFATRPNLLEGRPTELRGIDALMRDATGNGGAPPYFIFVWTEPDGGSWRIESEGADEATVRAVAEALLLTSAPAADQPVAELPPDAVPEGYEALWQATGMPKVVREKDQRSWMVQMSDGGCLFHASDGNGDAPLQTMVNGLRRTTVRGHEALGKDSMLIWSEAPGLQFNLSCNSQPFETMRQMAESLVPVSPSGDGLVDVNANVGPIDEEE